MFYFSERGLNDIYDGSATTTLLREVGFQKFFSAKLSGTVERVPSSVERVDQALHRVRRRKKARTHLLDSVRVGELLDLSVGDLEVGVLPFAYFGSRSKSSYGECVRVFWGHGFLDKYEIVLLGSLDNVRGSNWADPAQESLMKIGHAFPSDPSVLSELVAAELLLEGKDIEQHLESVRQFEFVGPGEGARFAVAQTVRADETRVEDDGYARNWKRQHPLGEARVVATVVDVDEDSSGLLLRPVLIVDRT